MEYQRQHQQPHLLVPPGFQPNFDFYAVGVYQRPLPMPFMRCRYPRCSMCYIPVWPRWWEWVRDLSEEEEEDPPVMSSPPGSIMVPIPRDTRSREEIEANIETRSYQECIEAHYLDGAP